MRDVDHHAEPVHLRNDLPPQFREPLVREVVGGLAGVRVGQLAVAVVGEREVPGPQLGELPDVGQVGAEGIAVLHPDQGHLAARGVDQPGLFRGAGQPDPSRGNGVGEPVDGGEFLHGLGVGLGKTGRGEVGRLPHIDDQEHRVQPPGLHLGEVHLGRQAAGVVAVPGEVGRVDVDVGVESHDPVVDGPGPDGVGGLEEEEEWEHA